MRLTCSSSSMINTLLILMLLLAPLPSVIELLSLKPQYQFDQFFIEGWRIFTSHLIHNNWPHLLLNVANLLLVRLLFKDWPPQKSLILFLLLCAFFISLGLWLTLDIEYYVGFSGIFHGLLTYLLLYHWKRLPIIISIATLALAIKIVFEQRYGPSMHLSTLIDAQVIVDAHTMGFIFGIIFFAFDRQYRKYRDRKPSAIGNQ